MNITDQRVWWSQSGRIYNGTVVAVVEPGEMPTDVCKQFCGVYKQPPSNCNHARAYVRYIVAVQCSGDGDYQKRLLVPRTVERLGK